jgi:hypothetical protein
MTLYCRKNNYKSEERDEGKVSIFSKPALRSSDLRICSNMHNKVR